MELLKKGDRVRYVGKEWPFEVGATGTVYRDQYPGDKYIAINFDKASNLFYPAVLDLEKI